MSAFLDFYDSQLLDKDHRIECRLRLDCFADGYNDDEIWSAWHQIVNRAAIIEGDQDGHDRVLEAWSYWLIEEYEAGKRGPELLEWFWGMLRKMVQEIYEPGA